MFSEAMFNGAVKTNGNRSVSRPKTFLLLASLITCLVVHLASLLPAIADQPVHVLATGVFATALQSLAPAFEASSGSQIQVSIANAGEVAARVVAGEAADVVMSSSAGIKALAKQGALVSDEVVIGRMRLGVAVQSGTAMQGLGASLASTEMFRALLLSADKIAYIDPNGGGTSAPFSRRCLSRLVWQMPCMPRPCSARPERTS